MPGFFFRSDAELYVFISVWLWRVGDSARASKRLCRRTHDTIDKTPRAIDFRWQTEAKTETQTKTAATPAQNNAHSNSSHIVIIHQFIESSCKSRPKTLEPIFLSLILLYFSTRMRQHSSVFVSVFCFCCCLCLMPVHCHFSQARSHRGRTLTIFSRTYETISNPNS